VDRRDEQRRTLEHWWSWSLEWPDMQIKGTCRIDNSLQGIGIDAFGDAHDDHAMTILIASARSIPVRRRRRKNR
jgi:hypothetical protein